MPIHFMYETLCIHYYIQKIKAMKMRVSDFSDPFVFSPACSMHAVTGQKAVDPPIATITFWTLQGCQDWCADSWECMAVDYHLSSTTCNIFSSLGEIETDGSYGRYVKDCSARKYTPVSGCAIVAESVWVTIWLRLYFSERRYPTFLGYDPTKLYYT